MSIDTDTKEVIVSKLAELAQGIWEKAGNKFLSKSDYQIEEIGITSVDLNSLAGSTVPKIYYWGLGNASKVQNKPFDAAGTLLVLPAGAGSIGTYAVQICCRRGTDDIYVRRRSDGSTAWSSWRLEAYSDGTYRSMAVGTASHLDYYAGWHTFGSNLYDETKPFALIGELSWSLSSNNGAGQILQFERNNGTYVRLKLNFITKGANINTTKVHVLESTISNEEVQDFIRITYFKYNSNSNLAIHIYVKFDGNWQTWRVRQLDCQSGDEGHTNWVQISLHDGSGAGVASPNGTQATYIFESEKNIKKAASVSSMSSDDTYSYTGAAISTAISDALSGEIGGFLGNKTVAQMNAYTSPKSGDNAIVTDTGTINVGSTPCVINSTPTEVRWTTGGSWQIASAGYVRNNQVATTSTLGLVKTNSASGGVNLNGSNQMVVVGWNDKQDALPICEGTGLYDIDIAGSASSIRNGTPTYYSTDALFIPIQASAPSGNTWNQIFNDALERLANKGRVFAYYGGEVVQNTVYEKYLQASYIYKPRGSSTPTEIHFNEVLDDLQDYGQNKNHGLIREYTFKGTGWESTSGTVHWPYYAENAVSATNAAYAAADSNGVSLIVAKNSSGKITSIGAAGIAAETASTAGYATSAYHATYADEATDAIHASYAVNDSNANNIITTYGHKQIYVRLPDIALVALPTGYSSVNSWTPLFDPPSSASDERKPEFHFYHLDLNFINVDFGGYDTVATELRLCNYYKTSPSTQIWSLTQLAATAIIVPKGSSSHNLVIPFQNNTLYPLRLVLEVKFGNSVVSGNAFGYQWYTSLAY